jgi:hypothetical protein
MTRRSTEPRALEAAFFEALAKVCSPESLEGAKRLLREAQARAVEVDWRHQEYPTVNVYFDSSVRASTCSG